MADQPPLPLIEHIRTRSAMYVGSPDFFGLIHYLVAGVDLLRMSRPTWIEVQVGFDGIVLASDVELHLSLQGDLVRPFEYLDAANERDGDGAVVAALSQVLEIESISDGQLWRMRYEEGKRISLIREPSRAASRTRLRFRPDPSIFRVTSIPLYNFHSYFRRMSYLNPDVRFRVTTAGKTDEYFAPGGLRAMFHSISAPYQILHEPIQLQSCTEGLEWNVIFGFQSWSDDLLLSFINKGRAAEGGSHEEGLAEALNDLRLDLGLPKRTRKNPRGNGIVALMSVQCPDLQWRGCIKAEIHMPALKTRIRQEIRDKARSWAVQNPEVVANIRQFRVFHFPESWSQA